MQGRARQFSRLKWHEDPSAIESNGWCMWMFAGQVKALRRDVRLCRGVAVCGCDLTCPSLRERVSLDQSAWGEGDGPSVLAVGDRPANRVDDAGLGHRVTGILDDLEAHVRPRRCQRARALRRA